MCQSSSASAQERQLWVENAVLSEVIALHPERLTMEELVARMEEPASGTGRVAISDAFETLKRSNLVRLTGEVVEPTHAALRAAAVLRDS